MVEINTFPCRGLNIEVSSGDAVEHAYIKYTENYINKEFLIESVSTHKSIQQIGTLYYKYLKDSEDNQLNTDVEHTAIYVPLPIIPDLPEIYEAGAPSVGQKIDQIGINSVLYELFGVHCYNLTTSTFAPPITADAVSTPCTYTLVTSPTPPPPPHNESNFDGTITVTPVDFIGTLHYTIIEIAQTNTTGIFENLDAGTYTVLVESDVAESPCAIVVVVEALMPE